MGTAVALVGFVGGLVALLALVRGRLGWARIADRRQAGLALAGCLVVFVTGAVITGPDPASSAAGTSALAGRDRTASSPAANPTTTSPTTAGPTTTTPTTTSPTSATPTSTSPTSATRTTAGTPTATFGTGGRQGAGGGAAALLAALPVKGRAPKTGYAREQFGQAWLDADRNGCDTRNDILRAQLVHVVLKPGTGGCVVLSGDVQPDPYTGQSMHFERYGANDLDIDHVVALSDAWQTGAFRWEMRKRAAFANDPLNLLAVDGSSNRQKGDSDAASWLPHNKAYRCAYVARQVAVKAKYGLWVTSAERTAIATILTHCPNVAVPSSALPTAVPFAVRAPVTHSAGSSPTARTSSPASRPTAPAHTAAATDPDMGTCKAAKAAGYGPYYQGRDPEYDWYQDRDHDGVVCE